MKEIDSLISQTAEALTGRKIRVEFVESLPGQLGKCFKRNEMFVIQLLNERSYAGFFKVFLHECAHIRLQWKMFIDVAGHSYSPGASNTTKEENKELEAEAEKLAHYWLLFAERHAWRFNGSESEKKLQALIYGDALQ